MRISAEEKERRPVSIITLPLYNKYKYVMVMFAYVNIRPVGPGLTPRMGWVGGRLQNGYEPLYSRCWLLFLLLLLLSGDLYAKNGLQLILG